MDRRSLFKRSGAVAVATAGGFMVFSASPRDEEALKKESHHTLAVADGSRVLFTLPAEAIRDDDDEYGEHYRFVARMPLGMIKEEMTCNRLILHSGFLTRTKKMEPTILTPSIAIQLTYNIDIRWDN